MRDHELIDSYVTEKSQDAFAQIVSRHMDTIYACARRQVRDPQLAEDVTQAVFIVLAKKAPHLRNRVSLAGWLVKTAHLAGRDALKMESRRRRHEAAAALAQSRTEQNMTPPPENLLSQLDLALARLNETERTAVALRYLQGNTTAETALLLGVSEPAAAKRITRALDHLRKLLLKKRAIVPAASLAVVLDQLPRVSAPAALAHTVTAAATTAVATPAGLLLANGVLHVMTWKKIFAAVWLFIGITGATGIGIGTVKLLADQTDSPPQATVPAATTPAATNNSTDLTGRLSNGVSIKIEGINESPPAGKSWWTADGKPAPALHAPTRGRSEAPARYIRREVAVRVSHAVHGSPDPATVHWQIETTAGSSNSSMEAQGPDQVSSESAAVEILDSPAGGVLRADVASGPWTTVCTVQGFGEMAMGKGAKSYLFSRAFTISGETHIIVGTMVNGIWPTQDAFTRLIAVDRSGHQIEAQGGFGVWQNDASMLEYTVRLPVTSISQWKLQSRSYNQWIEIRNISLHRGQSTSVKIVTSDTSK